MRLRELLLCGAAALLAGGDAMAQSANPPVPAAPVVSAEIQRDYFKKLATHRELELVIKTTEAEIDAVMAKARAACTAGYALEEKQFQQGVFVCAAVTTPTPNPEPAK